MPWSMKKPNLSHLRIFGCMVMVQIPKQKRKKFSSKSMKCIFIGYCENTKGYRFYDQKQQKVLISRDVIFIENEFSREVNLIDKTNYVCIFPEAYCSENDIPNEIDLEIRNDTVDVTNQDEGNTVGVTYDDENSRISADLNSNCLPAFNDSLISFSDESDDENYMACTDETAVISDDDFVRPRIMYKAMNMILFENPSI